VGGTSVSYTMSQGPTVKAGGLVLTTVQLVIIGLSVVVMAAVHGLLRYTKLGKAMRATAANRSLARNCGIRTDRVVTVTWGADWRAVRRGRHRAGDQRRQLRRDQRGPVPGGDPGRRLLGAPARPMAAMAGALIIGLATEISAAYINPSYKYVVAFGVLLVVMAVRPGGVLGATA